MSEAASTPVPKKPSPGMLICGGIAGVMGMVIGRYAGMMLLIPAVVGLVAGLLLLKLIPDKNRPMLPASAVQAGHGGWMFVGMALLSQFNFNLIDVVILGGGAIWLAYQPTFVPVGLLASYQVLGLILNSLSLAAVTANTPLHKALTVHVSLRVAAIALMVSGLVQLIPGRKESDETKTPKRKSRSTLRRTRPLPEPE